MNESLFTPAHEEAMKTACSALGKMFDGYLVVVVASDDSMSREQSTFRFGGGRIQAKGLATEFLSKVSHEDHGLQIPESGET